MQTFVLSTGRQEVDINFWDYLLPKLQNVTDLVMRGGSVPNGGREEGSGWGLGVGGGGGRQGPTRSDFSSSGR